MDRTNVLNEHHSIEFLLQPGGLPIVAEHQLKTRASTGSFTSLLASRKTPFVEISRQSVLSISSHSSLAVAPWYPREVESDVIGQLSSEAPPVVYPSRNPTRPWAFHIARDQIRAAGNVYLKRMDDVRQTLMDVMGSDFEALNDYIASIRACITQNDMNLDARLPFLTHQPPNNHRFDTLTVSPPMPSKTAEDQTKVFLPDTDSTRENKPKKVSFSETDHERITRKVLDKLASNSKERSSGEGGPRKTRAGTTRIKATKSKDAAISSWIARAQVNKEDGDIGRPADLSDSADGVEQPDISHVMPQQRSTLPYTYLAAGHRSAHMQSLGTLEAENGDLSRSATNSSQQNKPTYYDIPDDGSPVTIPIRRQISKRYETSKDENNPQSSLLVEYFEGGSTSKTKPSVRVRVKPKHAQGDQRLEAPARRRALQASDNIQEENGAGITVPVPQRTTASATVTNPKLLQTVEDAIRRLILPELGEIRRDPQSQSSRPAYHSSSRRIRTSRNNLPEASPSSRRRRTNLSYVEDHDDYTSLSE